MAPRSAWIAAASIALTVCDASPPHREATLRPPTMTATLQPEPSSKPPAAWTITIDTYGGFASHGKGRIEIGSEGSRSNNECKAVTQARDAVAAAVLAARPKNWVGCYRRASFSGMSDQVSYRLLYRVADETGKSTRYEVSWQDDSAAMRPADLSRLADAAWELRTQMATGCKP
jgi:hypothetical protein